MTYQGWAAALNGVLIAGKCCDQQAVWDAQGSGCADMTVIECLDLPPEGLGVPAVRAEDVTYAQRDGVRMFNDWYTNRYVTLQVTVGPADLACEDCGDVRSQVRAIAQAWARSCCDVELVIYTPCDSETIDGGYGFGEGGFGDNPFGGGSNVAERTLNGPFGIVGRPRRCEITWLPRQEQVAEILLLFVAVDQRMYVLDECGTPGYQNCVDVQPGTVHACIEFPVCFTDGEVCFSDSSDEVDTVEVIVAGTEMVYPTITLWPNLDHPIVENTTTFDYITYAGVVTDYPVIINTEDMTATQNGVSVTHLLGGNFKFGMPPGTYQIRLNTSSDADTGYAQVCWRDTVVQG